MSNKDQINEAIAVIEVGNLWKNTSFIKSKFLVDNMVKWLTDVKEDFWATQEVTQLWCLPENENTKFDSNLANAMVNLIVHKRSEWKNEIKTV